MRKLLTRSSLLLAVGMTLLTGGCATVEDVRKAQATADQALSAANAAQQSANAAQQTASAAQGAAQNAQQGVDQLRSDVTALGQRVQTLESTPRRGQRD